jgi:hypothetical protein
MREKARVFYKIPRFLVDRLREQLVRKDDACHGNDVILPDL